MAGDDARHPEAGTGAAERARAARGRYFMAVTANPHATRVAYDVLAAGGHAIDATLAAQMVLGLVEPQSSGLGGGGFLLYRDATTGTITAYDGRETAPASMTPEHFLRPDGQPLDFLEAITGGHAVGVPGLLRMLALAHADHGAHPWADLFDPAITLARNGFAVSPRLHALLSRTPGLPSSGAFHDYFFQPDGQPWPVGHRLQNPAYARTLTRIAQNGADTLYEGPLASAIVDAVNPGRDRPGRLVASDLADYRAIRRKPLCGPFRQYTVCGMPPPSSGGSTVLAILGMLDAVSNREVLSSDDRRHVFIEAGKLAFADRNAYLADPRRMPIAVERLVHPDYLRQRSRRITLSRSLNRPAPGRPPETEATPPAATSPELPSTSHLTVVDAGGNIVSLTSSIETAFGSRLLVGGFLLNNQLTDFSFQPTKADGEPVANRAGGGLRPRSSMAPTLVLNARGKPVLATGSPGGARIIPYVAELLMRVLEEGQSLAEATAAPHHVSRPDGVELEAGRVTPLETQAWAARGQTVTEHRQPSGLHSIQWQPDGLLGAADPRREGTVASDQTPPTPVNQHRPTEHP